MDKSTAVTTWRRALVLAAAVCDLVAGAVIAWWALSGAFALGPFALLFAIAGVLLIGALLRNSTRLLVVALVLTLAAELEPLGGVTASAVQRAPVALLGSALPLCAGVLAVVGIAAALVLRHAKEG